MEQSINNFLMTPIETFVSGALCRKERVISSEAHTNDSLLWFSKTPWIKVQSNAVPVEGNKGVPPKLREKWVLMGGTLYLDKDGKQRMRGSFDSAYTSEAKDYRPMPGIESLDVSIKGNIGLMREAKIKFKCYNLPQLEIMQMLYMTPGIGMLIEWGWSFSNSINQSIDLFKIVENDEITGRWLSKLIKKQVILGNSYYDAMFGIVSNFGITTLDDGTFDCETTVLAPSAFTVDINFNTPSNKIGERLVRYFETQLANTKGKNSIGGDLKKYAVFKHIKKDITLHADPVKEQQAEENVKQPTQKNDDQQTVKVKDTNIFITWQFFENTVNDFFKLQKQSGENSSKDESFIINSQRGSVQDDEGVWHYIPAIYVSNFKYLPPDALKDKEDPNKTVNWQNLWRSFSPAEVLIPNHPDDFVFFGESSSLAGDYHPSQPPYQFDISPNCRWIGDLRAVYLNWNIVVREAILNSSTMVECVNILLSKMNEASGGIWNLELSYNGGNFAHFRVIDMNCTETSIKVQDKDIFVFKVYTKNSIAKEVGISFTLPNALKSTVMISANGPQYDADVEDVDKSGAFNTFISGMTDAFAVKRQRKPKVPATPPSTQQQGMQYQNTYDKIQLQKLVDSLYIPQYTTAQGKVRDALVGALHKLWWEELTPDEKAACLKVVYFSRDIVAFGDKTDAGYERTIPIPAEVSLTIEGIAGFAWGNMFKISYLPARYLKRTVFTIKDISHKVDSTTWDTTIVGMMRIVPTVGVYDGTKGVEDASTTAINTIIGPGALVDNTPPKETTIDNTTPQYKGQWR